ncbi:MAG: hypothetical protein ABIR18_16255 [Chitinophagaceae bacterium]
MNRLALFVFILGASLFLGCTNEQLPEEKLDPDSIYFDYLAWGDEENGTITVKLQYRGGGPNQAAIVLEEPSRVEFDGQLLLPDSSKFTGPYYEVVRANDDFAGEHRIVFTDAGKKQYTTTFEFPVISLKTEIDSVVHRGELVLGLAGLKPNDKVRVLLTDTSFYGRGIEKMDTVQNDSIIISRREMYSLKNGPIYMEIFREEDKRLTETMEAGGKFYLTYGLKREFLLKDSVR